MDEITRPESARATPPDVRQASLPFERTPPVPLPFDDGADAPIGFALTARARRAVAPDSLPPLAVVADAEEDPHDTRPARARALRRAGFGLAEIARQLSVDDLLVRAWAGDVAARPGRRPSRAVRAAAVLAAPANDERPDGASSPSARDGSRTPEAAEADRRRLRAIRRDAATSGRRRLAADAEFALGVGLLAGLVTIDRHAVVLQTPQPGLAARVVAWVTEHGDVDPGTIRVVLRLGPEAPGDLSRHRWATDLGLPIEQLAGTRWRGAPQPQAVDALLRIADPTFAARLAGWCDALLRPEADPADVAF